MMAKPLVILAGPTAVGKSAFSVKLAKRINGSIISADSMQVYKGMDIGTAKISPEEMQGIPHYLIDVLDPSDDFNIVMFQKMAKDAQMGSIMRGIEAGLESMAKGKGIPLDKAFDMLKTDIREQVRQQG